MTLSITDKAYTKLEKLLKKGQFFRIHVDTGGCFGFQYVFSVDDKTTKEDAFVTKEKVNVLIDKHSLPFLEGAQLDYQEEMIGSHFVVKNPLAKQSCGCKNSFSFDL